MSIPLIVSKYRTQKNLSLRDFAAEISNRLPDPITYQTVKNWEDGAFKPSYYFILAVALHNDDWRHHFALEILQELKPEYYMRDATRFNPLTDI